MMINIQSYEIKEVEVSNVCTHKYKCIWCNPLFYPSIFSLELLFFFPKLSSLLDSAAAYAQINT